MAKCKYCNREMLTADGCGCTAYLVHGKKYPRIKVGDWQDYADRWYWSTNDDFKKQIPLRGLWSQMGIPASSWLRPGGVPGLRRTSPFLRMFG